MAGMLASQGVRTLQTFGLPDPDTLHAARGFEALVVSLKSRSIAPEAAIERSLEAATALLSLDPKQVQFKYCSTFDSTDRGNIGPVADALMSALSTDYTIAVPALPVNGRTQYMGYLFVNGVLLSESPMRHHPLNPMTEPNLVRHLQKQTSRPVGLVDLNAVRTGRAGERPGDAEIALVDAIDNSDLVAVARAATGLPLVTGGSGITWAMPSVWRDAGVWQPRVAPPWSSESSGKTLLLAGSCSAMTLRQIAAWSGPKEPMRVDLLDAAEVDRLASVCKSAWTSHDAVLVYSSAEPGARITDAAEHIESAFATLARNLRPYYYRIVVAGGETSGAVVDALGVRAVEIGPEIDPGVPALREVAGEGLRLALKSGNFGSPEFFRTAVLHLAATQ